MVSSMTISLPVAISGRLAGSVVLVARSGEHLFFATSLHLFGEGADIRIVLPPHGGNCTVAQPYPLPGTPALAASVVATDPFSDVAIVHVSDSAASTPPMPSIINAPGLIPVGTEVVVLGYPFVPIGSLLETWTPAYVTAIAKRHLSASLSVDELVLSVTAHPGSSGSAVVGKKDGVLYGIVRGALAPPEVLRIGDIPIATDTSVTFASSAHIIHELLATAKKTVGATDD